MSEYSLYGFSESGNSYKVALMLKLIGADWEPIFVDFGKGATREKQFRDTNVMGEVPVLVHHKSEGDFTLSQSGAILTYLAKRSGKFGGADEMEDLEILRWILFDNHKLTGYTASARFMRTFMGKADEPETKFMHARALSAFKVLDAHLDGRKWVVLDRPTIADISLCGYLFWPDHMGISWDQYPNIKSWLENIQAIEEWSPSEELLPSALAG